MDLRLRGDDNGKGVAAIYQRSSIMKNKKFTRIFTKVVLPFLILCLLAIMIWIHRETIKAGIYTDYGIDPYFEGERGCCFNCKVEDKVK